MPKREGEFEYHIRHPNEMHERIASEGQLSMAEGATATSEIIEYMGYRLEARPLGKGWRVLALAGPFRRLFLGTKSPKILFPRFNAVMTQPRALAGFRP
jgi:hypothetical protein